MPADPKDFISVADWSGDALWEILGRARELKQLNAKGERPQSLRGRTLAMYFEKPSLRTHVTFEAGITQLGGHAILLRPEQVGIGTRESPQDVARNLSRWVDGFMARTFSHALVEEIAAEAGGLQDDGRGAPRCGRAQPRRRHAGRWARHRSQPPRP